MNSEKSYDYLFKLILVGDSGAGKSCLHLRFNDDTWTSSYITTIGVEFKTKIVEMEDKKLKLQIWDTAGQERFKTISKAYYKSVHGVLFVYDLTQIESFNNLTKWIEEIGANAPQDVQRIIVGAKSDMEENRQVPFEQAKEFAEKFGMKFFETSSKNNLNVHEAFCNLTKDILIQKLEKEKAAAEAEVNQESKNTSELPESTATESLITTMQD
jgi:small GTP-binding protein